MGKFFFQVLPNSKALLQKREKYRTVIYLTIHELS